jgi:hypothetical protein
MASITALRTGVRDRLATISGLRVFDYQPDSLVPPAAVVGWPDIDFDFVMGRGADSFDFPIRIYVGKASDRASNDKLEGYLNPDGATSVKAAVEADKTLGAVADTTRVRAASGVAVFTIGGVDFLGVTFQVEVIA